MRFANRKKLNFSSRFQPYHRLMYTLGEVMGHIATICKDKNSILYRDSAEQQAGVYMFFNLFFRTGRDMWVWDEKYRPLTMR